MPEEMRTCHFFVCVSSFFDVISCSTPGIKEHIHFCVIKKSQESNVTQNAKDRSAHFHRDTKKPQAIQANQPSQLISQANPVGPASRATPGVYTDPLKPGLAVTGTGSLPFFLRYPFPLKISTSSEEPRFFLRSRLLLKFSSS